MGSLGRAPGELGASTIVGSAAFNLLAITAVCILAVPKGEFRRVTQVNVFICTSCWSLFAYVWCVMAHSRMLVCTPAGVWCGARAGGHLAQAHACTRLAYTPLSTLITKPLHDYKSC